MRRIAAAAVVGLLAITGLAASPVSAATPSQPKVVIIVGPVGSATASYKADGDAAYAEAREVHLERRQGVHAERDLVGRQEGAPGRSRS